VTSSPKDASNTKNTAVPNNHGVDKLHLRPEGYGPDGASDSPRPSPSYKPQEFQNASVSTDKEATTRGNKTITLQPEKESRPIHSERAQGSQITTNLPATVRGGETITLQSEKQPWRTHSPQGSQFSANLPAAVRGGETITIRPELGPRNTSQSKSQDTSTRGKKTSRRPEKGPTLTNHVTSTNPPPIRRRFAGSPALSVTSVESEQYTDLPCVNRHGNSHLTTVTKTTTSPITPSNVSHKNPVVTISKSTTSPIASSNVNNYNKIPTANIATPSIVNHNKNLATNVAKASISPLSSPKSKLDEVKARALARNQQSPTRAQPVSVSSRQIGTGPYDRTSGIVRTRYAPL